jgi:single-strand DNA-binding protein
MSTVNKMILIGHLGKDPEVRRTPSGDPVVSFSIATSENWRDKATGDRKERTEWHNIVIFNTGVCEVAEKYLRKGSKVYIEGQHCTRKYTDKAGVERYTSECVLQRFRGEMTLLDSQSSRPAPATSAKDYGQTRPAAGAGGAPRTDAPIDDTIPF